MILISITFPFSQSSYFYKTLIQAIDSHNIYKAFYWSGKIAIESYLLSCDLV